MSVVTGSIGQEGREDWHSAFAQRLIEDNFLLTALEFHAELVEAGRELPKLKEFFSNPGNFEQHSIGRPELTLPRSSSQATLDSLDLARFSEDGERAMDEKVAVLEFELRKAKETISALRANLTHAAVEETASRSAVDARTDSAAQAVIRPHEQRAINFLINEYLLQHGYKLTSITFADENESQDFDDWNDVGLNMARPRELLYLYREFLRGKRISETICADIECQTEEGFDYEEDTEVARCSRMEEELELLRTTAADLEREKATLVQTILSLQEQHRAERTSQASHSPENFEIIDGNSETKSVQSSDWTKVCDLNKDFDYKIDNVNIEVTSKPEEPEEAEKVSISAEERKDFSCSEIFVHRIIPEAFKSEILRPCIKCQLNADRLLEELSKEALIDITPAAMAKLLASNLPKIIPNIILNKREEVIPLLVLAICLCSDAPCRDHLVSLLYNLKKRPQEDERQQILQALLAISKTLGQAFTEAELLPQCWEQIGHKHVERRLLVAEACLALAPQVSETIRNSLLLSMIQQLAQDREEPIRACVVQCLAVVITLISVPDKFSQICEISLSLLTDESFTVTQLVQNVLLPAVAQWSCHLKLLQTEMLDKLISLLHRGPSVVIIGALEALLPYLVMFVASSETVMKRMEEQHPLASKRKEFADLCKGLYDPVVFFGGSVGSVVSAFDHITVSLEESTGWLELDWIMADMLPRLLKVAEENWDQKQFLTKVALFVRHLCAGLGKNITYNLIKPELSRKLEICSSGLIAGQVRNLEMIPIYLVGVLSLGPNDGAGLEQVGGTLLEFLCGLPLCGAPLLPLHIAIECLCEMERHQIVVLDTLWEGVTHQRPLVRSAAASLFQSVVGRVPEVLIASRVCPALVTLSSDSETSVKLAVIPTLGILADVKDMQIRDKITMTIQTLLSEASSQGNNVILQKITSTIAEHWEKFDLQFKTEVILPQLSSLAASCEGVKSSDLLKSLTETYSAIVLSPVQLPQYSLSMHVIPALRCLEEKCRELELPHGERVESLLRHAERLVSVGQSGSQHEDFSVRSPTTAARVEDVKNRVTKIFNTRPQSLQNVSGIFKKKL